MNEEWRPVIGYKGFYEVSNFGGVRSLSRMTTGRWGNKKLSPGRTLKNNVQRNGYLRVDLSKDGKSSHHLVHRLVAQAFVTQPEDKPHVNHIDNDKTNNFATNLEWVTPQENTTHGRLFGNIKPRTHCRRGHEYTPENTYRLGGGRTCRKCALVRSREQYFRSRAELRDRIKGL